MDAEGTSGAFGKALAVNGKGVIELLIPSKITTIDGGVCDGSLARPHAHRLAVGKYDGYVAVEVDRTGVGDVLAYEVPAYGEVSHRLV